jgi:hypothetical protein
MAGCSSFGTALAEPLCILKIRKILERLVLHYCQDRLRWYSASINLDVSLFDDRREASNL